MPSPRNLDLLSLEAFDMLLRECHVSRAAERLGLSQSSASDMLARLRERFDDPLLVRGREGMVPTPRALALLPGVRVAIEQLRTLLDADDAFAPQSAAYRFRLAASDLTQALLMPDLCARFDADAPNCAIDVLPTHVQRVEASLEAGELDLAVAYLPDPPAALHRSPLFVDSYVCIARPGHPCTAAPLTPASFAALSHISVAPSGLSYFSSAIDAALAVHGLTRRVAVSSPQFVMAALLVAQSELVLSLPSRAARWLAGIVPLASIEIPLALAEVDIAMYWHARTHRSAPHRWLRECVREAMPQVPAPG